MMKDAFLRKGLIFLGLITLLACLSSRLSLSAFQVISLNIFFASVLGTILFWNFRLAVTFLGVSLLIITKTIDIEHLVSFASLDVILFLVAMMIIMGLLREVNFFTWLLSKVLLLKKLTGKKIFIITAVTSSLLACLMDEVTSIIFMIAFVIELSDFFEIRPTALIVTSVMATNVGSAGTVLGNPIGILIASKAGLTFEDFLIWALPITILASIVTMCLLLLFYRREIKVIDDKLIEYREDVEDFRKIMRVPMTKDILKEIGIFIATLVFIALHHRLEGIFGFPANGLLLAIPLISAGLVMIWRRGSARKYVERDVDWWTLVFFMLLFATAGTLKFTGITDILANFLFNISAKANLSLLSMVSWVTFIGSSVIDNVVLVSAFIPVIHSFKDMGVNTFPLWWALLFGGCLGGNLTIVGSTANIVAIGLLERRQSLSIGFLQWFKAGLVIGLITMLIVWALLLAISGFMPVHA